MVQKAKDFVKICTKADASGHDYFHTLRVLELSETIAAEESRIGPVELETVQLIALLHDVDDRKLSPETCENQARARGFLEGQGMEAERIEQILRGIRQISFKGSDSVSPDAAEARIVQDADRLDAIGAIGIARTFAFGGTRGSAMYDPNVPPRLNMDGEAYAKNQSHTINHFYEKLLILKDMMNTETGKSMARHRHAYMEGFLEEFFGEWEGRL